MSFHDAVVNLGHGLALSIATGLILVMLIQPRRAALNIWFSLFLGALALWGYFAIARINPNKILFDETVDFYLILTGVVLAPLMFYFFVLVLERPQNYFEPVLMPVAALLVPGLLVLAWSGNLIDYTESGGDSMDLDIPVQGYILIAALLVYWLRSWWLLRQRERERPLRAAPVLGLLGTATVWIPVLLELPLGILLSVGGALLAGHTLLRWQLFTPLAEADAQLEDARAELRQAIRDISAEKQRTDHLREELADSSRYKGEFLTNMGHQLRTPLNSIVGYSELLLNGIYGDLNEKQTDRLEKIHRNSLSLLTLINEIMELNKLEGGRLALDLNDVRVGLLAESLVDAVQPQARERTLDLQVDLSKPLRMIRADELRIRQALLNLLDNAVKFTNEGYIKLRASNVTVQNGRSSDFPLPVIGWLEDRHWLVLGVEDSGIGIPPEEQAAIFEEFRQAANAVGYGGAGMGLAITKKLVELHTGRIWVSSQPGKGSTFYVALPALDSFDLSEETTEYNTQLLNVEAILLLIESQDAAAEQVQTALGGKYFLVRALDGPSGVARAHEIKPAAILVDITMPGLAGWDAIQRLKQDPDTADIPIIVMGLHADAPCGFALGASAYLSAPVQHDEFLAALAHIQRGDLDQPVLVVDDDAQDRAIIRQFLDSESIPAQFCKDGRAALDWLGQPDHQPGLVVVDFNMPGGFEVLRALRAEDRLQGVPVLLTCNEDLSDKQIAAIGQQIARVIVEHGAASDDLVGCIGRVLGAS